MIATTGRSAFGLARSTVGRDPLDRSLLVPCAAVTAWTESELLWILVRSGFDAHALRSRPGLRVFSPVVPLGWFANGLEGPTAPETSWRIAWYFAAAGAFEFGSGLAIVPFLHGSGVITVAFVGCLVAGPAGATIAAIAVRLPCYLLVMIPARYCEQTVHDSRVGEFVDGATVAAASAGAGIAGLALSHGIS